MAQTAYKSDVEAVDALAQSYKELKDEIAKMRGKDGYELGDFTMAMDEMSKSMVEEMTVRFHIWFLFCVSHSSLTDSYPILLGKTLRGW